MTKELTRSKYLILERCPHCRVDNPSLRESSTIQTNDHEGHNERVWSIYICGRCGGVVSAASFKPQSYVHEYYPALDSIDDSIPSPAYNYLQQANDSLYTPSGSIMLSASAIDAMLKLKGYKNGKLYTRIKKAANEHLITDDMAKWAHEVRLSANEQRHADEESGLPTLKDAQHTLEFAKALGLFLFILPSRIEKGIEAAENAKINKGESES